MLTLEDAPVTKFRDVKIKGDCHTEVFYSPWHIEVKVSREYKKQKEVYSFVHHCSSNMFKLSCYTVFEYDKKGRYQRKEWWSRNASTNDRNTMTMEDVPNPKVLKKLVMDAYIETLKFKAFEGAVDGPQPLPPSKKKPKKKEKKEKETKKAKDKKSKDKPKSRRKK